MKYKEINKLSNDELKSKFNSLKKDLFNLRFRKTNGQIENTASVSSAKKDIAKVLTSLKNKKKHEQKNIKR